MSELRAGTEGALRRIVQERQSEHRIPGVAAGVARSGSLLWSGGAGAADLDRPEAAPDEDTQFLVASITKTFTAVMAMQLRDEGKLSLDDTLDAFVPESKHEGVTIRQVLSHVTGMQREPVGDIWETLQYPDREQLVRAGTTRSASSSHTTAITTPTCPTRCSARSWRGSTDGRTPTRSRRACSTRSPCGVRRWA